MKSLDAWSAIEAGGWDPRYAVTLALVTHDDIAAALIDTNGDEAGIDLDQYKRDANGDWKGSCSGNADGHGVSWSSSLVAMWGRTTPGDLVEIAYLGQHHSTAASDAGWWLFIAPSTDDCEAAPRRIDQRSVTRSCG